MEKDNENKGGFELQEDVNFFEMFATGNKEFEDEEENPGDDSKNKKTHEKSSTDETDEQKKEAQLKSDKEKQELAELLKSEDGDDGKKGGPVVKKSKTGGDETSPEIYKVLYSDFVEKGILADLGDDFDGSEASFVKAVEETVVAGIEEGVAAEIATVFKDKERGQVAFDFFNFLRIGGTVDEFKTLRSHDGIKLEMLDAEDEAVRIAEAQKALTQYYTSLGWAPDLIKRQVERSKSKGVDVMVDEAKDVAAELQKSNAQKEKKRTEDLQTEKQKTDLATRTFNTQALSLIEQESEIAGFALDKAMKQKLKEYMFVATEDHNGKKIPKFAVDRQKAAETDPKFLITQALHLMNGMKPDDKSAQTKAVKTLTEKLKGIQKSNSATGSASKSGTSSQQTKQNVQEVEDFDFDPDKMEVVIL